MATQIKATIDYKMFEMLPFNRDVERIKFLETSMRRYGFLDAYPLHVVKNGNKKLKIKAGHHRFTVARKLHIPVKYVVCDDGGVSIYELEKATRQWKMDDYLSSYCRQGLPEYLKVQKYKRETGIALGMCIALLGGHTGSGNLADKFKRGEYACSDDGLADTIADIVEVCRVHIQPVATNANFVRALARVIFVDQFSPKKFKTKVKSCGARLLEPALKIEEHSANIERIYNHRTSNKIPLSFLADQAAKDRRILNKS